MNTETEELIEETPLWRPMDEARLKLWIEKLDQKCSSFVIAFSNNCEMNGEPPLNKTELQIIDSAFRTGAVFGRRYAEKEKTARGEENK